MKMTKAIFIIVAFCVLNFSNLSFSQEQLLENKDLPTFDRSDITPGEIIVKLKQGRPRDKFRQLNQRHGSSTLAFGRRDHFARLRIAHKKSIKEAIEEFRKDPDVEYAEPNYQLQALMTPNDPYYVYQWDLKNIGGLDMPTVWDTQTGNPSVIVAVVDTGVAYENFGIYQKAPDLANTSFVPGYDFINNDSHPNDDNSHGTHVTGTIAQSTNNALGTAGIAFRTSIMPVKVLAGNGSGPTSAVADGIIFAADNGAKVINLSLGSPDSSLTLENALAYAYNKGVTIACAAGNDFQNGNPPFYPAAYDKYCIAVGATRYDKTRSYYSNTGSYVDVAAPGGDSNVDQNGDGYGDGILQQTFNPTTKNPSSFGYWFLQGTSMATPHVAGVAALLIAKGITGPDQVRKALETTAQDLGPAGWDQSYGWGLINVAAALQYSSSSPVHDVLVTNVSAPAAGVQGDNVAIAVSVANQGSLSENFDVQLIDKTDVVQIGIQNVSLPANGTGNLNFSWNTASASLGNHLLSAEAWTVNGETNTDNNSMTTNINIQEPAPTPIRDMAMTALNVPLETTQGNVVPVTITVENQGTVSETTTVTFIDQTANAAIGSQSITVAAGASTQISFNWNTSGATIGSHSVWAVVSAVPNETDTTDNAMATTINIKQKPPSNAIYVGDIGMALSTRTLGTTTYIRGKATVNVTSATNSISGALVKGVWSGATTDTESGFTDSTGKIVFSSNELKKPPSGTKFIFTVTSISKLGMTYDPASNVKTSGSVSVP